MISLRDSVRYGKDSISMKNLAYRLELPAQQISLRALIAPESFIAKFDDMSSGDVHASVELIVFSNGFWIFSGHVSDDCWIFGDTYSVIISSKYGNGELIALQRGKLDDDYDSYKWDYGGHDPWIYTNWENLKASGFAFECKLRTDPDNPSWNDYKAFFKYLGYAVGGIICVLIIGSAIDSVKKGDIYIYYDEKKKKGGLAIPI